MEATSTEPIYADIKLFYTLRNNKKVLYLCEKVTKLLYAYKSKEQKNGTHVNA